MKDLARNADQNESSSELNRFADNFFEQEGSPYQPERIETGRGSMPALIRYMPHAIIGWSVAYVLYQAESNYINYIITVLLVLWSGYNLIAARKKWPPVP